MNYGATKFDGRFARSLRRDVEQSIKELRKVRDESLACDGDVSRSWAMKLNRTRDRLNRVLEDTREDLNKFENREKELLLHVVDEAEMILEEIPRVIIPGPVDVAQVPMLSHVGEIIQRNRDSMSAIDFNQGTNRLGRNMGMSVASSRTNSPHGSFRGQILTAAQEKKRKQELEDERIAKELAESEKRELGAEVERVNGTPLRDAGRVSDGEREFIPVKESDYEVTRPKGMGAQKMLDKAESSLVAREYHTRMLTPTFSEQRPGKQSLVPTQGQTLTNQTTLPTQTILAPLPQVSSREFQSQFHTPIFSVNNSQVQGQGMQAHGHSRNPQLTYDKNLPPQTLFAPPPQGGAQSFSTHPPTQIVTVDTNLLKDNDMMKVQLNAQAIQIKKLTEDLRSMKRLSQNYVVTHPDSAQDNSPQQQVRDNQGFSMSQPQVIPVSSGQQSGLSDLVGQGASGVLSQSSHFPVGNSTMTQDALKFEVVREVSALTNDRVTAQNILLSQRPPEVQKFSGDDLSIDFESFMGRFENVSKQIGVTQEMILSEMHHWFKGSASIIVTQFQNVVPASLAISKIKEKLTKEFGNKKFTAKQLMDSLLKGKPLSQNQHGDIRVLLLNLDRLHDKACETGRGGSFNNRETFKDILNKKLPHLIKGWGKRTAKNVRDHGVGSYSELTFVDFLKFCSDEAANAYCSDTFTETGISPSITPSISSAPTPSKQVKTKSLGKGPVQIGATNIVSGPPGGGLRQDTKPKLEEVRSTLPKGEVKPPENPKITPGGKGCLACGFGHQLAKCRNFAKKTNEEKVALIRAKGVCFLCLKQGHMSNICPDDGQISCEVCQGRHNSLMHRKRPEDETVDA